MVKAELCKILAIIAACFNNFTVDDIKENVWMEMFGDVPYQIAQTAVKKYILTGVYPPTVADIRKIISELTNPDIKDGAEAWGEVIKAIRGYGYYREEEAMESMSPLTAKVVKYMGFREVCMCEEVGVVRGQFLKMYEQVSKREKENNMLPESLQNQIRLIANNNDIKLLKSV